ncbi:HAMP domain-containing histidine kinase [Catenovulum sp. 2E275]|uniref:sensor histidine kinase n=1 Tax=Catenovulum sp. 2E275 TaxID=2980497 RepID=UPI0021CE9922|nr:HAMP domain-containing sensor histidine kinase [Catenovulum sp. 2E275]MCU4675336.1 HAMP domain-containing histidine kinase [Catenovulum sp. 2E275]
MKSIRKKLVSTLSVTITGVVLLILLATDIAVDGWIDSQFNKAMVAKLGMLKTLVIEQNGTIEANFSARFLPEFEGDSEPEYYQLWLNGKVLARSASLDLFTQKALPYLDNFPLAQTKVIENTLPDGRSGRIIYNKFTPSSLQTTKQPTQEIVIAYACAAEGLNFVLWLIDIIFVVTTISVIIFIRVFVRKTVDLGLSPLHKMNEQIRELNLAKNKTKLQLKEPVSELLPVVESLNRFMNENHQLYLREKRLTSDISHELKTPISELINLTEVVLKFPDNNDLMEDFAPQVLSISQRLQHIVSHVLLLHKYRDGKLNKDDIFDINQLLDKLINTQKITTYQLTIANNIPPVRSNLFAVESILLNLLKNAQAHKKPQTEIKVTIFSTPTTLNISIENEVKDILTQSDIAYFFEPLWQKDSSRTSSHNYGLGLSIAKMFADSIDASLCAELKNTTITLSLTMAL